MQRKVKSTTSTKNLRPSTTNGGGPTRAQHDTGAPSQHWMRSVSFAGLQRVLHVIASHPNGLTAAELNNLVLASRIYETRSGARPAPTTLYHCRNTLLQLNAVLRDRQRLFVNLSSPWVQTLISRPAQAEGNLDVVSREAFAELVLQNRDCRTYFFDLFMEDTSYGVNDFRLLGNSVTWKRMRRDKGETSVITLQTSYRLERTLNTPSEINAILYGLRYWARDELQLIDEFFRDNRGSIMYPIRVRKDSVTIQAITDEIISRCRGDAEWTTFSVIDLVQVCGEERKRPVALVLEAIRKFARLYSGHVVLIATSRSFAALSAGFNKQRQDLNLRSYLRDSQGRYISHIRIHESIRSLQNA